VRSRLYEAYAPQQVGSGGKKAATVFHRREICPKLPPPVAGPIVPLGCRRAGLVRLLQVDGFDAEGIDTSSDQADLTRAARARAAQRAFSSILAAHPVQYEAIMATDLLEHLIKLEVQTFDDVSAALAPGGVLLVKVPDAASSLRWHIRDDSFTYQTARSIRQLAVTAGFDSIISRASPCIAHALARAVRVLVRHVVRACHWIALVGETGTLRRHIVTQNPTFAAPKGAGLVTPAKRNPA
jgi:hypothetical protein